MSFTLDTEIDGDFVTVTLTLDLYGIKINFVPEECESIRNVNVEAEAGVYETDPSNGSFGLEWSPVYIILSCSKFGGGDAGELNIRIPSTPELLDSLRAALIKWKRVVAENDLAME